MSNNIKADDIRLLFDKTDHKKELKEMLIKDMEQYLRKN